MITRVASDSVQASSVQIKSSFPPSSLRFDWIMTGLAALFLAGLWIDGWAHFHDRVDNTFFTPWHLLFYSAFGMVALFLAWHHLRGVGAGYRFGRALPQGYGLSLVGVAVFGLSGFGDMIWHTLFGIEAGSEALLSPTHIGLAIGMMLVFTGPVRAAAAREGADTGWIAQGPRVLCLTMVATLLMFFTSYANPIVTPQVLMGRGEQDFAVISIFFMAALLAGFVLLLVRSRAPFGAYTVFFALSTLLLTVMNDLYMLAIPALIAGVILDVAAWLLKPARGQWRLVLFMFLAPFAYFALYFAAAEALGNVRWSIHVWTGTIFIAGMVGGLVALLVGKVETSVD
jgi:hypothetical protein